MFRITVGNNLMPRIHIIAEATNTPRQVLEEASVDFSRGITTFNGCPLTASDFNKSFEELGASAETDNFLLNVVKADNA